MFRVWIAALLLTLAACAGGAETGDECTSDTECPDGQCVDGACVSLSCSDDFDCPLGALCTNGQCRTLSDEDVGGANNGETDAGDADPDLGDDVGVDAGDDAAQDVDDTGEDAPEDAGEDAADTGTDADEDVPPSCAEDSECEANEWCDDGACVAGCHLDAGCLIGQECDLETHSCVDARCRGQEDCADDERCDEESGECVPAPEMCLGQDCADAEWCDFFGESCIGALPGDACTVDADCGEGMACGLSNDAELAAVTVCLVEAGVGAGRSACEADADCRSGLCLRGLCFEACAGNDDCAGEDSACATFSVVPSDNGTPEPQDDPSFDVATCVDSLPCARNADCPEGQVCGVAALGDELAALCMPVQGDGVHGSPCAADGDCRSGRCEGQAVRRCIGVCAGDEDCGPTNTECVDVEFDVDDQRTATFPICDWAAGSGALCTSHAMCPNDEVCTLDVAGDEPRLVCRPAWGEDGPGVECELSNECQTGLCNAGRCFGACEQDNTCLGGTECFDILLVEGADAISMCVEPPPSCFSDEDCEEEGTLCLPFADEDTNMLLAYCLPESNEGGRTAGETCTDNSECASDFCVGVGNDQSVCYGICNVNGAGCAGDTRCYPDQITFTFDQGTPNTIDDRYDSTTACAPDFGSYQACGADAQCPGNEICFPTLNEFANNWANRCIDPLNPGGLEAGETCTNDSQCRSNICLPDLFGDVCFGPCRSSADCQFGQSCLEVYEFVVNDRGTPNEDADDISAGIRQCTNF